MASIIYKKKSGREYVYWVRSGRVNGKPRIVEQVYLGPRDRVLERIKAVFTGQETPKRQVLKQVNHKEFGATALLWHWAQRVGLADIVDRHVPPPPKRRRTRLSVGQYLVIAALNRAVDPKSKRGLFDGWYKHTVLSRLWDASGSDLTSQRFWDHMDQVEDAHIELIQRDILDRLADLFPLGQETVLYDTTNFFTFIDTFNTRTDLAQRGNNKQRRKDLRQVSLALFEDRATGLPLCHQCYAGNQQDAPQFPLVLEEMRKAWMMALERKPEQLTLVFDRGSTSRANLEHLEDQSVRYVAGVPARWVPELLEVPLRAYQKLELPGTKHVKAYRIRRLMWGKERTLLVVFSPSFYKKQRATMGLEQRKAHKHLTDLAEAIASWKQSRQGKGYTETSVRRKVRDWTRREHLSDLLDVDLEVEGSYVVNLSWTWDLQRKREVQRRHMGKQILVTDRDDWSDVDIVTAYRRLTRTENLFRITKSRPGPWWPMYHWTDSKMKVHALYCFFSLLLLSITQNRLREAGMTISVERALDQLVRIQESRVVYADGQADRVLSNLDDENHELALTLGVPELARKLGNTVLDPS
jgi:transposase